jgi:hypothetical protein
MPSTSGNAPNQSVKFKCTFNQIDVYRKAAEAEAIAHPCVTVSSNKLAMEKEQPKRIIYDLSAGKRTARVSESTTETGDSEAELIIDEDVELDNESDASRNI